MIYFLAAVSTFCHKCTEMILVYILLRYQRALNEYRLYIDSTCYSFRGSLLSGNRRWSNSGWALHQILKDHAIVLEFGLSSNIYIYIYTNIHNVWFRNELMSHNNTVAAILLADIYLQVIRVYCQAPVMWWNSLVLLDAVCYFPLYLAILLEPCY